MTDQPSLPEPLHQTATFSRGEGRIRVRFGLNLENNLEQVWAALTDPEKLAEWLAPGRIEARPGGAVSLRFPDSGIVIDSVVAEAEAPRVLEYSWSAPGEPTRPLRFELQPVGAAVGLIVTLSAPDTEDAARMAAGWAAHLDMLTAALAGAPIKFPFEVFKAAREAYSARLADGLAD